MKKYSFFFVLLFATYILFSCESKQAQGSRSNMDAIGDADSLSPYKGNESPSIAKATVNGKEMEFKFVDIMLNYPDGLPYTESPDGKFTNFGFELGSDERMSEKIGLMLVNYNLTQATLPFSVPKGRQDGKQARLDMGIQKSNVIIPYSNQDNFDCQITKFSEDQAEGTFAGEVKNASGKVIKIENGSFKIKIKKMELKMQ